MSLAADTLELAPVMAPDEQRRLACLALAIESRTSQTTAEELVVRARVYDRFVRGDDNPYARLGED